MKRYNSYKDSGIEWVGEVPNHWKRFRIKYCLSRSAAGVWGEDEKGDNNDIVCFRIADFDYNKGILSFEKITIRNIQDSQLNGRLLKRGDLLIEKSGGGETTPVGRVVRYNYNDRATCSNFIHAISVKDDYSNDYLYYYFFGLYANKENLLYFNQTTGIQNLKIGEYLSQTIFLPLTSEQQAIASYLDKRCGEIDKAIAKQQKRIELLQELRQNIITNAVTRGIDPDAPLKESGVEWIEQVPEHWEVMKIKHVVTTNSGATPKNIKGKDTDEANIIWVRTTDLTGDVVKDSSEYLTEEEFKSASCPLLPEGTVLVAMYGGAGTIGKCGILGREATINQALCSLIVKRGITQLYLFYCTIAMKGYWMKFAASSRKDPNISQEIIRNVMIPIPPEKEQNEIVQFVVSETKEIDDSIKQANKRIALLQELKQSIITEVVTGKRKVC